MDLLEEFQSYDRGMTKLNDEQRTGAAAALAWIEPRLAAMVAENERLTRMASFVGGSPHPIPWPELQRKYVDRIEELEKQLAARDESDEPSPDMAEQARMDIAKHGLAKCFVRAVNLISRGHADALEYQVLNTKFATDPGLDIAYGEVLAEAVICEVSRIASGERNLERQIADENTNASGIASLLTNCLAVIRNIASSGTLKESDIGACQAIEQRARKAGWI